MKKILAGLMAAAVFSGVAMAQTGTATSANAVGFINVSFDKAGALKPVVMPFDLLGSDVTDGVKFTETQMAMDLPFDSEVYFWDGQQWLLSTKDEDPDEDAGYSWSGEAMTKILAYGEMFFVKPSDSGDFTLAGEVPDAPSTKVLLGKGAYDAVGFAYPTPVKFSDTQLAKDCPFDTEVYFWDGQQWLLSTKDEDPDEDEGYSWSGEAITKTLNPGEGFFVKFPGEAPEAWEQSKPYDWP